MSVSQNGVYSDRFPQVGSPSVLMLKYELVIQFKTNITEGLLYTARENRLNTVIFSHLWVDLEQFNSNFIMNNLKLDNKSKTTAPTSV